VVTGDDSDPEARVGERLIGEFIVNARILAFGRTRKR
jgi:hypothetical protein